MTADLLIVGAGDSGKELFAWASPFFSAWGYRFKGYLDDVSPDACATIVDYQPLASDVFICSIGAPAVRVQICDALTQKGARFINVIHPSAVICSQINAHGIVAAPFVYVSHNVVLGDYVMINVAASIGHDVTVGKGSVISAHVDLTGHVILEEQVFMGSHACVIPKKKIGARAIVGAGSAVMRNVPADVTVVGVPATRLK